MVSILETWSVKWMVGCLFHRALKHLYCLASLPDSFFPSLSVSQVSLSPWWHCFKFNCLLFAPPDYRWQHSVFFFDSDMPRIEVTFEADWRKRSVNSIGTIYAFHSFLYSNCSIILNTHRNGIILSLKFYVIGVWPDYLAYAINGRAVPTGFQSPGFQGS